MRTRLPSLNGRPTVFVGLSALVDGDGEGDGDLSAGTSVVRTAGADGIEITAQVSRDGAAVISSSPSIGSRFRRRRIQSLDRADLGADVADLPPLLKVTVGRLALWINTGDDVVFEATLAAIEQHGGDAEKNIWLAGNVLSDLVRWRPRTSAKLILATRLSRAADGMERLLAELHGSDIDGVTMFHTDWSGGTITLAHRFGLLAVASGATHGREMAVLVDGGIDAFSGDDPNRMTAIVDEYYR